jgi:hypothetical protein
VYVFSHCVSRDSAEDRHESEIGMCVIGLELWAFRTFARVNLNNQTFLRAYVLGKCLDIRPGHSAIGGELLRAEWKQIGSWSILIHTSTPPASSTAIIRSYVGSEDVENVREF